MGVTLRGEASAQGLVDRGPGLPLGVLDRGLVVVLLDDQPHSPLLGVRQVVLEGRVTEVSGWGRSTLAQPAVLVLESRDVVRLDAFAEVALEAPVGVDDEVSGRVAVPGVALDLLDRAPPQAEPDRSDQDDGQHDEQQEAQHLDSL